MKMLTLIYEIKVALKAQPDYPNRDRFYDLVVCVNEGVLYRNTIEFIYWILLGVTKPEKPVVAECLQLLLESPVVTNEQTRPLMFMLHDLLFRKFKKSLRKDIIREIHHLVQPPKPQKPIKPQEPIKPQTQNTQPPYHIPEACNGQSLVPSYTQHEYTTLVGELIDERRKTQELHKSVVSHQNQISILTEHQEKLDGVNAQLRKELNETRSKLDSATYIDTNPCQHLQHKLIKDALSLENASIIIANLEATCKEYLERLNNQASMIQTQYVNSDRLIKESNDTERNFKGVINNLEIRCASNYNTIKNQSSTIQDLTTKLAEKDTEIVRLQRGAVVYKNDIHQFEVLCKGLSETSKDLTTKLAEKDAEIASKDSEIAHILSMKPTSQEALLQSIKNLVEGK
jgi:vacuolar-type H+-ATPase subunit I/STV1